MKIKIYLADVLSCCMIFFGLLAIYAIIMGATIDKKLPVKEYLAINEQETTVIDILEFLETKVDRKIRVNYESFRHPNWIDPDTTIKILRHDKIHYIDLVEEIIDQLEAEMDTEIRWQYIERDTKKGIDIGTKGALSRHRVRIIYQVDDLSFVVTDFKNAPDLDLDSALNQSGNGGLFDNPEDQETEKTNIEQITDLITEFVEPDDWKRNGGEFATIRRWKGGLIIVAPKYIHQRLDKHY